LAQKYCSLICCERKTLFLRLKSTADKPSEQGLKGTAHCYDRDSTRIETGAELSSKEETTAERFKALFIRLIIRLFQLVFSTATLFFSHNKSANSVFQPAYQHRRTGPKLP
jgi:hypothetical protein